MVERKVYASLQKGKEKLFMVEGFYRHLQKGNTELFYGRKEEFYSFVAKK
jgi:hypothetical protein